MRLSTKSEYACLALIDLAERYDEGFIKKADIARRKHIPRKYLEQILLTLKRAGYLRSHRGAGGGYSLAKPPRRISVAEIVRLMDGPLAPIGSVSKYFYEPRPVDRVRRLIRVLRDIRNYAARRLETTKFSDLLDP